MFSKQTLKNGLTLLTSPMPTDSVAVMVMVKAGSRYETRQINGLSHFLEHMAFKGTKKRPSAFHISREIDAIGGEFNAFTSKDHTAFFVKAASNHLELILDILSDMISNSLFKSEEIEREKGVIIEEINMYEDTPMRKVGEEFENLMFGDSPMGWDIAGKAENIRVMKREDFISYVNSLYKTGNMVVAIAGGIPPAINQKLKSKNQNYSSKIKNISVETHHGASRDGKGEKDWLIQKVNEYFGNLEDKKTQSFEKFTQIQSSPRLRVHFKKTEQAHLVLGFPGIPINDPRRYALSVLTTILGGGMSSRLFIQVRERRGLAYYVHASADYYADCGAFSVSAGVDLNRIDEAIKTIQNELFLCKVQSSRGHKVQEVELKKAKEYLKGHLILGLEDSQAVAGFYASQFLLEKKVETPSEVMKMIDKVTLEDVQKIAETIFDPKKINLAVIGPFKDPSRFEKLIN